MKPNVVLENSLKFNFLDSCFRNFVIGTSSFKGKYYL